MTREAEAARSQTVIDWLCSEICRINEELCDAHDKYYVNSGKSNRTIRMMMDTVRVLERHIGQLEQMLREKGVDEKSIKDRHEA